jgi:hypothetical protein
MATYSPFLDAKARLKLDGALLEADLAILDEWSATRKLRFYLWFAMANWERGTSFTCERRAAMRINKESSCQLQITQRIEPRLPPHPSA